MANKFEAYEEQCYHANLSKRKCLRSAKVIQCVQCCMKKLNRPDRKCAALLQWPFSPQNMHQSYAF